MLPTGSMRNPNLTALLLITNPVSESDFDNAPPFFDLVCALEIINSYAFLNRPIEGDWPYISGSMPLNVTPVESLIGDPRVLHPPPQNRSIAVHLATRES